MASRYIANTPAEQREMLRTIGASSIEDLLVRIPPKARLSRPLALPPALAESELVRHLRALAARNADAESAVCFLGGGAYDHYVPSPINHLISRGEFFTAYTPYQPEASPGTLRTIYEYQTMIAELTGMDVANASIYDGASSLAEAALMAHSVTERTEIVLARGVNPLYRRVVATYCDGPGIRLRDVPAPEGVLDAEAAAKVVGKKTAALVIQSPNFYGCLEDVAAAAELAHALQSLLADGREIDGGHQRAERDVRADVRRRLRAPDVLLACLQRQHEAAPPVLVDGGADEIDRIGDDDEQRA